MKTKYIITALLMTFLISCSEKTKSSDSVGEINLEEAIENAESRRSADPDASGGNKCLLGYQEKLNELLTEKEVLQLTGFSKHVMKTKDFKMMGPENYHIQYNFKNKRIGKVMKYTTELPDVIKVGSIKPMSIKQFNDSYRAISDEEMDAAKGALAEITEGKSGNTDAEKAMEQAKQNNVSDKQVKETAGVIMEAMKEVSEGYRKVKNMGDAAVYNLVTQELIILQNGVKFEVKAEISNDEKENRKMTFQLAELILNKCK